MQSASGIFLPAYTLKCRGTPGIWGVFLVATLGTGLSLSLAGFNSLVGGVMGFSILLSAEVFKHNSAVWYLDGSIGVLIGLTIFAYGVK